MTIVITGATGHLGRQVVEQLLARGVDPSTIVAGGRNEEALGMLASHGVRTARVDYADATTLDTAFAGADKILLISGNEVGQRSVQHKAVIDAARRVDAPLVYTSAPKASTSALVLAPEHKATEGLLEGSGLTYTVLRNNWYTENYDDTIRQAASTGAILTSAGDGSVASATRRDYAEAAAVVLLSDEYTGEILELGGDEPWTMEELAATVSDVAGNHVTVNQVSTDEHIAALKGFGLDEGTAGFVAAIDANIADGLLAESDGSLSRTIGRPTTPLKQYVSELLGK
ncbi:SDR family oxidoreductase [Arthrobacter sp. NamB2]|uniref:SDR family oxidoreductase n=1 Tax=Arthrobacter sp. NamB2 TaxID=2576035 RepID=UPI0010C9FAC1|nr:SDR family oxidoreductase [Arthrobacter sp. NamB2]TKV27268.1 SDR family oxidoreductase [Arthrobacter sp. NamB2]